MASGTGPKEVACSSSPPVPASSRQQHAPLRWQSLNKNPIPGVRGLPSWHTHAAIFRFRRERGFAVRISVLVDRGPGGQDRAFSVDETKKRFGGTERRLSPVRSHDTSISAPPSEIHTKRTTLKCRRSKMRPPAYINILQTFPHRDQCIGTTTGGACSLFVANSASMPGFVGGILGNPERNECET